MTDISRLSVELVARMEGFEPALRKGDAALGRATRSMGAKVDAFDQRLAKVGGNKLMGLQQAGYQIGDFAVQVASGQNVLTAFIQQGSQVAGAFGPWGAIIGAAGAVAGALAVSLWDSGDAAEKLELDIGGLESGVGALETTVRAYIDAIEDTSTAQSAATSKIVADTKREFEAKKELLRLEVLRQEAQQAERGIQIAAAEAELGRLDEVQGRLDRMSDAQRRRRGGALEVQLEGRDEASAAYRQLVAEATLAEIAIERANEAIALSFDETVAAVMADDDSGSGAREKIDKLASSLESLRDRLEAMRERAESGAAAIGLEGEALARHNAQVEVAALKQGLLNKARDEGRALTPEDIASIDRLGSAYVEAAVSAERLKEAEEDRIEAAEEAARVNEQTVDSFSNAITQAESFADALRNVALAFVEMAAKGALLGEGPLGGLQQAFSAVAAPLLSASAAPSVADQYALYGAGKRAAGGPVLAGRSYMVGEHGPEPFVPAIDGRILSIPQAQAAVRGDAGTGGRQEIHITLETSQDLRTVAEQIGATAGAGAAVSIVRKSMKPTNLARSVQNAGRRAG